MFSSLRFLSYSILLISIYSIIQWSYLFNTPLNNTYLWWFLQFLILYNFYRLRSISINREKTIAVFLAYSIISFLYGIYMAENYLHYKYLVRNLLTYLIPLCVYTFINPQHLYSVLRLWFKKIWILLLLLFPFLYSDAWGNILTPFFFLILFFRDLPFKWKIFTIFAFIITFTLGWASRSCIIRLSVAFIIGAIYVFDFGKYFITKYRTLIYTFFLTLPIISFILAATGMFNVFKIDEEFELSKQYELLQTDKERGGTLLDDTRTLLYKEVIKAAIDDKCIVFGHSLARGYYAPMVADFIVENTGGMLKGERIGCEVLILNIFTYMGIVGVILFMMIIMKSVYLALFKSNNDYVKVIALFLLFRWIYSWIEELQTFSITYITIWLMIAICFSNKFRDMSDKEFKRWFLAILK